MNDKLQTAASKHNMVYHKIDNEENEQRIERINKLVRDYKERKRTNDNSNEAVKEPDAKKQKEDKLE